MSEADDQVELQDVAEIEEVIEDEEMEEITEFIDKEGENESIHEWVDFWRQNRLRWTAIILFSPFVQVSLPQSRWSHLHPLLKWLSRVYSKIFSHIIESFAWYV